MITPSFREYAIHRARGDAEFRELVTLFGDELLDAPSWRQSWDILREGGFDMPFVLAVRKAWDDYSDVLSNLDKNRLNSAHSTTVR
ncbi:hypothetical protein [Sphingosinicella sp. LY1275]|uniref:hypothetical protein n=1 Tax=Sphingosinicella sp. LY1275 TaxID=3095379 RepID=UPI002ADEEBC7|nr:hypothetical protein [Sphingosinicella sp. LY1275]MEA1013715.1 hypothetical protein [Sphingosinicella sp. LY1275]